MNVTDRQKQIVQGIADGLTSTQIAEKIGFNYKTVEKETLLLRKEFGALSSYNLVAIFFRQKLIK